MYATGQEWRPVMPYGWQLQKPADELNIIYVRTGDDAALDEEDVATQHAMMRDRESENLAGNHEPRNHPIRVPTAPGEPVRG